MFKNSLFLYVLFFSVCVNAQFEYPPLSSKARILQMIGNTEMEVVYERPSVRNRIIFGELVPFDKIWRTGAAECTTFGFNRDVSIGSQAIKAGKYSLFTIPSHDYWTVILNSDTTLYGSHGYDIKKDVARFKVVPEKANRFFETLTIDIDIVPNNAVVYIAWANTQIHFELKTTTDADVMQHISDSLRTRLSSDAQEYLMAADYYYFSGKNTMEALDLVNHNLELEKSSFGFSLKASFFEKLQRYDDAIAAVKEGISYEKAKTYATNEELENELNSWNTTLKRLELLKK